MIPKPYTRAIAAIGICYVCWHCLYMINVDRRLPGGEMPNPVIRRQIARPAAPDHSLVSTTARRIGERTMAEKFLSAADNKRTWVPEWLRRLPQRRHSINSKYYLTAVVRVRLYKEDKSKWTIAEFKQWMHYQFWAGAEHIYVCNHYLNESESLLKSLEKYTELRLVTVFSWNTVEAIRGSKTYEEDNAKNQNSCYQHVLDKYRNQSVWQYNFDMDENPYCPKDQSEGFLTKFLKALSKSESDKPQNEQIVEIRVQNFILHGQGDRTRNTTYERINRITPNIANGNWKTVYKVQFVDDIGMHGAHERTGELWIADPPKLKMLHYWGARAQKWGPDTPALYKYTVEFNDVRDGIAISVRNSLLALNETDAFSCETGP